MKLKFIMIEHLIALTAVTGLDCACQNSKTNDSGWSWARQAIGRDWAYGTALAVDDSGNAYVTGFLSGETAFNDITLTPKGELSLFLVKYGPHGDLIWVKQIGDNGRIAGTEVAVGVNGKIYVLGSIEKGILQPENGLIRLAPSEITSDHSNFFVIIFDQNGEPLQAFQSNANDSINAEAISVDDSGNYYVTGSFKGKYGRLRSKGGDDLFLAKYNYEGRLQWAVQAGGAGDDEGKGIATNAGGSIYVTGLFDKQADFQGELTTGTSGANFFIAKYSSSGEFMWVRTDGGKASQSIGYAVATDRFDNCYVTGSFGGQVNFGRIHLESTPTTQWVPWPRDDFFLVKFTSEGVPTWARHGGGEHGDSGQDIAVDIAGNVYVTGSFFGSARFDNFTLTGETKRDQGARQAFVAKYDPDGVLKSIQQSMGIYPQTCVGNSVAIGKDGFSRITGFFDHTVTFGHIDLKGARRNMFIAKADSL